MAKTHDHRNRDLRKPRLARHLLQCEMLCHGALDARLGHHAALADLSRPTDKRAERVFEESQA